MAVVYHNLVKVSADSKVMHVIRSFGHTLSKHAATLQFPLCLIAERVIDVSKPVNSAGSFLPTIGP